MDTETTTVHIETEDSSDELTVPAGLLERFAEGDQTTAETVGDVVMLSVANNAHHWVHHDEGGDAELEREEAAVMDLFEERFGMTFGEATGHQH